MNPRLSQMSGTFQAALSAVEQGALVDLWEIDLRSLGGERYFYCNQTNEKGRAVVWQGVAYEPYPITADGFETSSQGAGNRPNLTVSNILGFVTAAAEQYGQLVGAVVVRRQTYAQFLDAVNFKAGNPTADPAQEVVTKYVVERLAALTAETATLELAAPSESDGAVIPARMMLANTCPWQYRGGKDGLQEGCPYRGRPVADRFDMPTGDPSKDACSGTLTGCRARFGATASLPFGGFPSCDKV
ncbi:phage minor tail protein L, partial [Neisseria weixii]